MAILVSALACAAAAGLSPLLLRPRLHRSGVLDVPNARSAHAAPKLRGMGIATAIGMLVGTIFAPTTTAMWLVIGFSTMMAVIGFIDDVRSLSARTRFALQFAFGLLFGAAIAVLFDITWWVIPVVAIVFAAFVNMANFMDGANGISSLFGAVAGAAFAVIGFATNHEWLTAVGVLIGMAFLLFLPWNVLAGGMFLGDCGSYLLGSSVATTSIAAIASGVPWPAALAPMAVYATDTSSTIITRVIRRERWWEAHRQHLYQQMIDSGSSHLKTASLLAGFVALASVGGMASLLDIPGANGIAACSVVVACVAYVLVVRLVVRMRRGGRA